MSGTRTFVIRKARADDVERILPLVEEICELHRRFDSERFDFKDDVIERYAQWLPQRAADEQRSVLLVAERVSGDGKGELLGYVVGTVEDEVPIYWTPSCGYVHDVFVRRECRGEGIGLALARGAIERFFELGMKQVRLITAAGNDDGRRLFARAGLRPCTIEMMIVKPVA